MLIGATLLNNYPFVKHYRKQWFRIFRLGGLPQPYFRVHPPLLFGTVGILVCTGGILGDVVSLRRCARWCRFSRKASRKPAPTPIPPPALIWSASDLSGILRGNRHCTHRVRSQHRSGVAYHCVKQH